MQKAIGDVDASGDVRKAQTRNLRPEHKLIVALALSWEGAT